MVAAYSKSGNPIAKWYTKYREYNKYAYVSATHGQRYVNNYANKVARKYGKFEKAGTMPRGSVLVKDSFVVQKDGTARHRPAVHHDQDERAASTRRAPTGSHDDHAGR